jgi:hypothetical protein
MKLIIEIYKSAIKQQDARHRALSREVIGGNVKGIERFFLDELQNVMAEGRMTEMESGKLSKWEC